MIISYLDYLSSHKSNCTNGLCEQNDLRNSLGDKTCLKNQIKWTTKDRATNKEHDFTNPTKTLTLLIEDDKIKLFFDRISYLNDFYSMSLLNFLLII